MSNKSKDYFKLLDDLLDFHLTHQYHNIGNPLVGERTKLATDNGFDDNDRMEAEQKLLQEGYIRGNMAGEKTGFYKVTIDGCIFITDGKYKGRNKKRSDEKDSKYAYVTRMENNASRLTIGTWFLVGATLALAIVEIVKYCHEFNSCH